MDLVEKYLGEDNGKLAGWIAIYNGKKLEIKKSEANGIYGAKQLAIKHFKVPKSKQGLLAIEPAYDDDMNENILATIGSIGKMPGSWGERLGTFGTVLYNALTRAGISVISLEPDGKFDSKLTVIDNGMKKTVKLTGSSSADKVIKQIKKLKGKKA